MSDLLQRQEIIYLIYTGVAPGVLLAFTGLAQMMGRKENLGEVRNRRMRMLAEGKSTAELLALLKPRTNAGPLSNLPFIGNLPALLTQAGVRMKPQVFLMLCLTLTIGFGAGAMQVLNPMGGVALGITAGLLAPVAILRHIRKKRMDTMVHQLPDALDLLARGLKVGHPLNNSIGAVAQQMADPIASEFGIIFDSISYGDDLTDAFTEFAERVDIEDVYYLSASIGIQYGTGGDLCRVIQVLSRVIRNRITMRRKIQAITSEGRLTAWFLSGLPVAIFAVTSASSPDYFGGVREDPMFVPMMSSIVFFTVLNFLVLRKITNFRI